MGLFGGNPVKKAKKAYEAKMKEAMEAQRSGDIQGFAALNEEAEALLAKLKELEQKVT
jgi:hypothetical protein